MEAKCASKEARRAASRPEGEVMSVVRGKAPGHGALESVEQRSAVDVEPQHALDEGGATNMGSEARRRRGRVRLLVRRPAQAPGQSIDGDAGGVGPVRE